MNGNTKTAGGRLNRAAKLLAVLTALLLLVSFGAAETWEDRLMAAGLDIVAEGTYTDLDHVAAYLVFYGELPSNYVTKKQARKKGWSNGEDLWKTLPGYSLGGDSFGNREGLLPKGTYRECDLFYEGGERGNQRLIYSEQGELYYTQDGYKSFTLIYPSNEQAKIPNEALETKRGGSNAKAEDKQKKQTEAPRLTVEKNGTYTDKEHVALYIHTYGKLPSNFITKSQAQNLGWSSSAGNLGKVAPGKSIGGDRFGNYEGTLPENTTYRECDIDYTGGYRGSKRIIYGADGSIYYTEDHYNTFERLY